MRGFFYFSAILALAAAGAGETSQSAAEVMARVALNQDVAEKARAAFVYRQNVVVRLRDSHGHLVREEISEYQAMPDAKGTRKDLVKFTGRYANAGSMSSYAEPGDRTEGGFRQQADISIAQNMRKDLTSDSRSKDGLAPDVFPLTAKEQVKYRFTLKGEETYRSTKVYRIAFEPKDAKSLLATDEDDTIWSGEALVSKGDFQPLLITTKMGKRVPFWVRTLLGTNVPGMGFSIQYEKFADGVWFPVSLGAEFRLHVLFVYSRQVAVSVVNSDFRRADVQTGVEFEKVQ